MSRDTLKRLKLRDQLSVDPLKIFSLFEKTVLAYIVIGLVLIAMKKRSNRSKPGQHYMRNNRLFSHDHQAILS